VGINSCILAWMEAVGGAGVLDGLEAVLEMGPQDFFFPLQSLEQVATARIGPDGAGLAQAIMGGALPYSERQALFYSLFGLKVYASVDTYDDRATFRQDLNSAPRAPEKFDLLVDFGTSEHVFNIGNAFVYTHNTLRPGGVCLKVLPTFGDNCHGFYNIHPTVYFDIARVNDYDILDFRYVDDMISRPDERGCSSLLSLADMDGLNSFAGCAAIQSRISRNFADILDRAVSHGRIGEAHNSVDYCFVALRKRNDTPFRYPGQGVYLTEFPQT